MSGQDFEQLTLFQEDSPASRSVQPGSAEARTMTATSGQQCAALLKKSGPLGSLARTCLESSKWRSTMCFLTWKLSATPHRRLLFRLVPSKPRTSGKDAPFLPTPTATLADHGGPNQRDSSGRPGLQMAAMMWPTPAARDYKGSNSMEHLTRDSQNRNHRDQLPNAVKLWPTPTARNSKGASNTSTRQGSPDLQTAVMFPTPTRFDATCGDLKGKEYTGTKHAMKLIQAAKMYPTPTTGAGLCGGTGNYNQLKALEDAGEITPEERRSMAAGNGGQLNPDWVEALMGFPPGWTALESDGATGAGSTESPESPPESQTE